MIGWGLAILIVGTTISFAALILPSQWEEDNDTDDDDDTDTDTDTDHGHFGEP
jgi:hypothetical protein